jgi:hypothetical protein
MFCGGCQHLNIETLRHQFDAEAEEHLSLEVYTDALTEDDVELALLNDFVRPLELAFVGGKLAKMFAAKYGDIWIEDTPKINEELLRFWGILPR